MDQKIIDVYASEEQVKEALMLVRLAGFVDPDERLACEAIIRIGEKKSVEGIIDSLQKLIDTKEDAYQKYVKDLHDRAKAEETKL